MRRANWLLLFMAVSFVGTSLPAAGGKPSRILARDMHDWQVETYCGNPNVRTFVPGDKFQTALYGIIVFDGKGNGYVASGTFIAIVTPDGQTDVLTGEPGLAGCTDGPPGRATFGNAIDIALVNDDLLYVVDAAYFTLRRIQRVDGVWHTRTVAGVPGRQGHRDGPGRKALFMSVLDSLTVDEKGAVYIFSGNYIRKFHKGVVTTLNDQGGKGYVNGPLRQARFIHSQGRRHGLTYDGKGNLYVADKVNVAIRKVDLKNGQVTTFAGCGPDDPRDRPRDGAALDARFHPGGGPNVIFYNARYDRFICRSDDERAIRVIRREGDQWVVNTLAARKLKGAEPQVGAINGMPCGVDADGNIYVARGGRIDVLRNVKDTNR